MQLLVVFVSRYTDTHLFIPISLNFTVWMNLLQMTFLSPLPNKRRESILKTTSINKLIQIMLGERKKQHGLSWPTSVSCHSTGALKGGSLCSLGAVTKMLHQLGLPRTSQGLPVDLSLTPPGMGLQNAEGGQRQGNSNRLRKASASHAPVWLLVLSIPLPSEAFLPAFRIFSPHLPISILTNLLRSCRHR